MAEYTYFRADPASKVGEAIRQFYADRQAIHDARRAFTEAQGAEVFYTKGNMVAGLAFREKPKLPGWRPDRNNKHLERDGLKVYCPKAITKEGKQLEMDLQALQFKWTMFFDSDLRKIIDPSYTGRELPIIQTGPHQRGGFPTSSMTPLRYGEKDDIFILAVPHTWPDQKLCIDQKLLEANGCTEMKQSEYLELKAQEAKRAEKEGK